MTALYWLCYRHNNYISYMRRWLVERFFAWIQWQRRILIRWEYHAHNFLGFVQLACLVILFKRF
jgi:transposase